MNRRWTAFVLATLTTAGCTLEYLKDPEVSPDQVPLMVFEGLKQSGLRDGKLVYTMESERSEVFQAKKQMRLNRLRFQEYDSTGQPASSGEAESAVIDTSTNDATLGGHLVVRSEEQGVTLTVSGGPEGGLTWKNEDRVLKTQAGTGVHLAKDDGSQVEARGLTLDLGSNRLELEEGVLGTWTPDTTNDDKAPVPPPSSPLPVIQP